MNWKSPLAQRFSSTFAVRLAGVLLVFVAERNLAAWLGAEQYGTYTFCRSLFMTLGIICLFGTHTSTIKHSAVLSGNAQYAELGKRLGWARRLALIVSSVFALIAFVYLTWRWSQMSALYRMTYLVAVALIVLTALNTLRQSVLRGIDRPALANLPKQIIMPLGLAVISSGLYLAGVLTSISAMLALVLATAISLVVSIVLYRRYFPGHGVAPAQGKATLAWYVESASLAFYDIMLDLIYRVEILMLGVVGTLAMVGEFNVALRYVLFCNLPVNILSMVVAPSIARAHANGDTKRLQGLVLKITLGQVGFMILLSLPLLLWPNFFLSIFGPDYTQADTTLVVMVLGIIAATTFGPCRILMAMADLQTPLAIVIGLMLVVDVVLNYLLIPVYGTLGAAMAAAIFMTVTNLLLSVVIHARTGIHTFLPCSLLFGRRSTPSRSSQ